MASVASNMSEPPADQDTSSGNGGFSPRKRRRTAKACANCRRRKIRCSGGEPCEPCRIGDNVCFYEEGGRMTATAYIQSLERKLGELENLLKGQQKGAAPLRSPHQNGGTPSEPPKSVPRSEPQSEPRSPGSVAPTLPSPTTTLQRVDTQGGAPDQSASASLPQPDEDIIETMVDVNERTRPMNTPGSGNGTNVWDSHRGSFAGLSLLRRVHNLCRSVSGLNQNEQASPGDPFEDDLTHAFDIAPPDADSTISWEAFALLPSREKIEHAIDVVVNQACCNLQFLDREVLTKVVDDVYDETEGEVMSHARKPLALLYSVLALSRRYDVTVPPADKKGERTINGLRYFRASRALLDPANCQDVMSLRALLCMILYTQASSMMSTCYSYICMAVAASLQMGLFTESASKDLPESEKHVRRRIAAVLYMMDTYVTTALGLPRTLRDMEPDRALPTLTPPTSIHDPMFGTYAHSRLIQILAVTVESNHPVTKPIGQKNGFYGVEYSKIVATEEQLERWYNQLLVAPSEQQAQPGGDDSKLIRSQLMLRMYYAHVQMVLYRPFLHHALKDVRRSSRVSMKAYACGSACIKASMQVVWLAERMEASDLFNAAHWFVTLIVAFTAACLVLFVTSNQGDPTVDETAEAVRRIRDLCSRHAQHNTSMRRCLHFLESLPQGPPPAGPSFEPWNAFNENLTNFAEAFRSSEESPHQTLQGEAGDDEVLQAHNLPQLRSFLNTRM
ncbi:hypothetical protein KC330_g7982 [Hortaea werneckii]|nr:hypothetical protein KC330_g7982 [Hortaea werneckii]